MFELSHFLSDTMTLYKSVFMIPGLFLYEINKLLNCLIS